MFSQCQIIISPGLDLPHVFVNWLVKYINEPNTFAAPQKNSVLVCGNVHSVVWKDQTITQHLKKHIQNGLVSKNNFDIIRPQWHFVAAASLVAKLWPNRLLLEGSSPRFTSLWCLMVNHCFSTRHRYLMFHYYYIRSNSWINVYNVLVVNSSYWHKMTVFWTEKQDLHMWTSWTRRENSLPQNWIEQKSNIKKHQVNENLLCVPSNLLQIDLLKIGGCRISKKIMFSAAIYHGREGSNIISSKSFVFFFGVLGSANTLPGFLNTEKNTHAGNYCKCSQYSKPVTLHY